MSSNAPAAQTQRGINPQLVGGFGIVLGVVWLLVIVFSIATSEANLSGSHAQVTIVPDWNILQQIPTIVQGGHISPDEASADVAAYIIELIHMMCVIGFQLGHDAVIDHNHKLSRWFVGGIVVTVLYELYSNFQYAPSSNPWLRGVFTTVMEFALLFFGIVAVKCIEKAWKEWQR